MEGLQKHLQQWQIPEARKLQEQITVTHLIELGSTIGGDQSIWIDLVRYQKRTGKLPPVSAIRGYKGGFFDSKFEQRRKQFQPANEPRAYQQQQQRKPEPTQAKAANAEVVAHYVYEPPRPVATAPHAAPQVQVQQPEILSPEMTLERIR